MIEASQIKIQSVEKSLVYYAASQRTKLHLCDQVYQSDAVGLLHTIHVDAVLQAGNTTFPLMQTRAIIPLNELDHLIEHTQEQISSLFTYPAVIIPFNDPHASRDLGLIYLHSFREGRDEIDRHNLHVLALNTLNSLNIPESPQIQLPEGYSMACLRNQDGVMVNCENGHVQTTTIDLANQFGYMYSTQFGTLHYPGLVEPDYHLQALADNPVFLALAPNGQIAAFAQLERDTNISQEVTGQPFYEGTWLTSRDHRRLGLSKALRIFMAQTLDKQIIEGLIYTESRWKDSLPASLVSGWLMASHPKYRHPDGFSELEITGNLGPYVQVANHDTQMGVTYYASRQMRTTIYE